MNLRDHRSGTFRAIDADNGSIAFSMLPELGGKLVSLRDLRTGREWLWLSDRIPLARHSFGVSYIAHADSGGWDECFPTVAPCIYPLPERRGVVLPDHGDVWSQGWSTQALQQSDGVVVRSSCRSVTLPCEFERVITLPQRDARIVLDYRVHNSGESDVAFIWSAHPLLRIEPGMRIEFPDAARFNVYSVTPPAQLAGTIDLEWPLSARIGAREVLLDPLPGQDAGVAFKIWSDPLDEGRAALIADDGAVRMRFDPNEIPQIGLWLNAGGWSGIGGEPYYNCALEPCIGAQDSLEDAVVKHQDYAVLKAGATRRWTLHVELTSATPELGRR